MAYRNRLRIGSLLLFLLLGVALGCEHSTADKPVTEKPAVASLEGEWKIVSGTAGGKPLTSEALVGAKMVFSGDNFLIEHKNKKEKSVFKIDLTKQQHKIAFWAENSHFGIFELKGDSLRLCMSGVRIPKSFDEAQSDPRVGCFFLERT